MSERGLPPYPRGGDWTTWARELVEFLSSQARSEEYVAPRVVSLLHQIPPTTQYRALTDGLLMYDPALGVPVYSEGGSWNQFTTEGSLNYLVTDDAGDGTVEGDINATNFSGQEGAVGQCAQTPVATVVNFFHKGVQYLYTGPTPGSYGLGCADTMLDTYLIPTGAGSFLALIDTPSSYAGQGGRWLRVGAGEMDVVFNDIQWTDVNNKPATFPPSTHTHTEDQIDDLDRVRWRGNWVQQQYEKNDMVLADANWLMIANKQTTEVAPPREDPTTEAYDLPDNPLWVEETFNGVVESGRIWATDEPVTVVGYQVWVPELSTDTSYRIQIYREPTGQSDQREFIDLGEPLLIEDGWATVSARNTFIPAGYSFAIVINALNSGSDTQPGGTPADWIRTANDNNVDPTAGNWNRSNNNTILRIHENTADNPTNNPIDLQGTIAGTRFEFVSTTNPNQSITYVATTNETLANNVYSWTVEVDTIGPQGEPPVGTRCLTTITVPVPAPTRYVTQLAGNPTHTWGTSQGVLRYNGVNETGREPDAFGVRILTREWDVPVDWDIASALGSGSSGGSGGGASSFTELTDTPASYAGEAGKAAVVNPTEDGLYFADVSGGTPSTPPIEIEHLGTSVDITTNQHTGSFTVNNDPANDVFVFAVAGQNSLNYTACTFDGVAGDPAGNVKIGTNDIVAFWIVSGVTGTGSKTFTITDGGSQFRSVVACWQVTNYQENEFRTSFQTDVTQPANLSVVSSEGSAAFGIYFYNNPPATVTSSNLSQIYGDTDIESGFFYGVWAGGQLAANTTTLNVDAATNDRTHAGLLVLEPVGAADPVNWGDITGTLSNQTDLQAELDAKADATGLVNEFHDPTGVASWKITGNTLQCWGTTSGAVMRTVNFPKTFASAPIVSVSPEAGSTGLDSDDRRVAMIEPGSVTTTAHNHWVAGVSGTNVSAVDCYWSAIGEWDGIS